jgi:hypothetical protein
VALGEALDGPAGPSARALEPIAAKPDVRVCRYSEKDVLSKRSVSGAERQEPRGRGSMTKPIVKPSFTGDQVNRLWEYRNHVDREFFSRLSFFSIVESILFAVAAQLHGLTRTPARGFWVFVTFGFIFTAVWAYCQIRMKYMLDRLSELCEEPIPEYRLIRNYCRGSWPISTMSLLGYAVPNLFVLAWIGLFIFA